MKNEEVYTLHGKTLGPYWIATRKNYNEGLPYQVSFDFEKVFEDPTLIGFWHTHPGMTNGPSTRDIHTMSQWALQEGKTMPCLIQGIDGLACWMIDENKNVSRSKVFHVGSVFIGKL